MFHSYDDDIVAYVVQNVQVAAACALARPSARPADPATPRSQTTALAYVSNSPHADNVPNHPSSPRT